MKTKHDTTLLTALEERAPHAHLCSIYDTVEERLAVAVLFIEIGLTRGEKCIYITDDNETGTLVQNAMAAEGIDVEHAIATGNLLLIEKRAAYLKHGTFDPEWMYTFWTDHAAEATRQGFPAMRVTGETEWVVRGPPGLERWIEYETRLARLLAAINCFALCQYNRKLTPPELVQDIIRTHGTVIYRGTACRNMYYSEPDELVDPEQAEAREVEHMLTAIREREEIERTLLQQRGELRQLSRRLIQVQEAERRSVARELHDDFGQLLTALRLNLQNDLSDRADSIALVDEAIGRMRDLALDLRPAILDELGLAPALRWYGEREARRAGLEIQVRISEPDERLPPPLEITCFRLVQEALTNVVRHAQARSVTVALTTTSDEVLLAVSDDGIGFELADARRRAVAGTSQGLIGMQERVSLTAGELVIDAAAGRGTSIRARFPRVDQGRA